ncbi:hypothetical protein GCM10007298_13270 [Williamsia phyllosphaerae]|uniref:Uncharacterized protein n=1 Tax=Williamsia phyllosphaerae TaxID=885042 RepID=A0ABQ1UH94_9NOCA|nr:hypothetical protein GCM10007298_13270 [Williamsia phyllosphaerae]
MSGTAKMIAAIAAAMAPKSQLLGPDATIQKMIHGANPTTGLLDRRDAVFAIDEELVASTLLMGFVLGVTWPCRVRSSRRRLSWVDQ